MLIDIHTHLVNPNFYIKEGKTNFAINLFLKKTNYTNYKNYIANLISIINASKLDKTVLIAIENSEVCANNEQVLEVCKNHSEFLYGVNLNPFDKDIDLKVQNAHKNGVVLVKILPSFQNVDLSDKGCIPFFELLKEYNLPLLVHTGKEYTLKTKFQNLNNPDLLENAAKIGVKIICAHCGTRIFLHEKNYFKNWAKLAMKYENVYGDLSAMITPVQIFDLKKILKSRELKSKVIFGSDYPGFPCDFSVKATGNPIIDSYNFYEKIGFDDTMFKNAEKILNL